MGTTGLLIASAVVLLLVGGAVVAFDGWPGSGRDDRIGEVVVGGEGVSRLSKPQLPGADAARAVAARRAAGRRAAARGGVEPTERVPGRTGGNGGDPAGPRGDGDGGAGGGGSAPARGARPAPPAESPGGVDPQVLADQTEGAAESVGQAVGTLNPQAGRLVTETGRALHELVQELAPPDRR